MMNLIDLELNLSEGRIDNDIGKWMSEGLSNLKNLSLLNLVLIDNYIDNYGFGIIMENLIEIEEVVLDVNLNNMIEVDNELNNEVNERV